MAHWQIGNKDEARKSYDLAVEWSKNPGNLSGRMFDPAFFGTQKATDELLRSKAAPDKKTKEK